MSITTNFNAIGWCHYTVNFWWGCTKVSPACANCYAEGMARRLGNKLFGHPVPWGPGSQRGERLAKAREECLALDRRAAKKGVRYRVFINSMSDWLDDEVPVEWLAFLHGVLRECKHLDYLLLTKRPENFFSRINAAYDVKVGLDFPTWSAKEEGWWIPRNVWVGITVENQSYAHKRIPYLSMIPAKVLFLSCEPLLGPVVIPSGALGHEKSIDWVIAGGESGAKARISPPDWLRALRDQCAAAGVPFFFKQWGAQEPGHVLDGVAHREFPVFA